MAFIDGVTIVALACVIIVLFLCYRNLNFRRQFIKTLPGPKTYPLIGNAHHFLRTNYDEFLDIAMRLMQDYPSPFQFWMGNKLLIGIYDPDQVQIILQSKHSLNKGIIYKMFEPIFGIFGLITAPVFIWRTNRKMMTPSFNTIALRDLFEIFVQQALTFMDELEKISLNGNEITFLEYISRCTLNIACGTVTGNKFVCQSNKISQISEAAVSTKKTLTYRLRNFLWYFDFIFNLTATGREQRKNLNILHSFVDEMIQQQIRSLNKPNTTKNENKITHEAVLDILLEMTHKNHFKYEEIHDNLITMLFAASDTTAIVINFVIFMLANFPEIQEKVYQELTKIYSSKNPKSKLIAYEDLQYMHYLDRVIKETMRLFPPVPLIGRRLTENLKIGEFILPKDADIIMGIITVHRNEKYWPNPLVFDPDRFIPENIEDNSRYYFPFSNGPRNCIGMKYAMLSMKVILATLIRTFRFKVDTFTDINQIKLNMDITLHSIKPLKVKIEKRFQ